ncbi:lipopolysaccharide heptosyltransferase II [Pontibacter sp. 172403-2]|uniref:lipopolysaccharide heptosyltransferase II n=1 Tax=Pontibacter rufus TaxID=2791028 RepID=UPI0018AFF463|nr:lipopolysaccharide heptosyltransferase II [Pontibacter sp. 172403-2]MBF9253412.1 lipopolysaccharide heptosyltransferase II [Pontibacter sp. 172403-2]
MKILVRLPNWLGDMVMSTGFLQVLRHSFPEAQVDVIIKAEYKSLAQFLPGGISGVHTFPKAKYKGLRGAYRFGRLLAPYKYDLFFSLPDSFSAGVMGWATGAKYRIGYRNEGRALLFTHAYARPKAHHRVDAYSYLLEQYLGKPIDKVPVALLADASIEVPASIKKSDELPRIVLNFNSEAQSRRMPVLKAVSILQGLAQRIKAEYLLLGGPKDTAFVEEIMALAGNLAHVKSLAGKTSLPELVSIMAAADLVITTDSGPAHVANSLNRKMLVFFGAGDEASTGPYNRHMAEVMQVPNLICVPCRANTCRFGVPLCLLQQDEALLVERAVALLARQA